MTSVDQTSQCSHFTVKTKVLFVITRLYRAFSATWPVLSPASLSPMLSTSSVFTMFQPRRLIYWPFNWFGHPSTSAPSFIFSLLRVIFLKFSWLPSYIFAFIFLLIYLLPKKVFLDSLSKNHRTLMTSLLCLLIIHRYQICPHLSYLRSSSPRYTFFSNGHRTFSRIDHILGQKSSLSKFKKIWTHQASCPATCCWLWNQLEGRKKLL